MEELQKKVQNPGRLPGQGMTNSILQSLNLSEEEIIRSVIEKLGFGLLKMNLEAAKKLITGVEEEAAKRGMKTTIAVCSTEGNPIAVHVMDGALLASFDLALKKAYTSVAVKMSTKVLGELAQPGNALYGIDKGDNGRLIIIGGGVPLMINGVIIGGLGVSGGTAEQDTSLAEFGSAIAGEIMKERQQPI